MMVSGGIHGHWRRGGDGGCSSRGWWRNISVVLIKI